MFRAYDKNGDISYSLGAFPTIELIKKRQQDLKEIVLHSRFKMTDELEKILAPLGDLVRTDDKSIARIAKKGNVYMAGAFKKRWCEFNGTHIALHRPSDGGNLGTIMRTMLGFGIKNLAIIGDAVDAYDPHTVRASMGAIFSLNISTYSDWAEYSRCHTCRKYLFMLDKRSTPITSVATHDDAYALVFGNEASGLPAEFATDGMPVIIKHTDEIDSLNLPQAVAIGLYELTKNQFNHK